uniref:Uncharacterized protein n=1 Tax=Myotis myotis TaxID=51298 RepID=A0A7J7UD24_MYOMY|nr:hypothetical protein mMyoMyo1_008726 [Myotis myotis]
MNVTPESVGKYWVDYTGDLLEFKLCILRSRKATSNIQQIHVETNLSSHVKDTGGIRDGDLRVSTATSHVEADTNDINVLLFCLFQKKLALFKYGARFNTEMMDCFAIFETNFAFGCALATFINSTSLSKVIIWIPLVASYLIRNTCLRGFA